MGSEADVQESVVTVLQGLATGTLLYVVFFEVIEKERLKKTNGLLMVAFIFLGAVVMTLVQYIEVVASAATLRNWRDYQIRHCLWSWNPRHLNVLLQNKHPSALLIIAVYTNFCLFFVQSIDAIIYILLF